MSNIRKTSRLCTLRVTRLDRIRIEEIHQRMGVVECVPGRIAKASLSVKSKEAKEAAVVGASMQERTKVCPESVGRMMKREGGRHEATYCVTSL